MIITLDNIKYYVKKSTRKNNKYMIKKTFGSNGKFIHFGNPKYQHFKDKIGMYSYLDHNDPQRRDRYLKRARGIKDKQGNLTYKNKNSANYFSINLLW